ncbi:MAG: hypothetical protein ACLQBB_07185 [Solirubrobacteraceae bacterium]
MQSRRHSRRREPSGSVSDHPRSFWLAGQDDGETESRHEPQSLRVGPAPVDPYAAWLEQREAERERVEQPGVRWVHRPRVTAAQREQQGPGVRWVNRQRTGPAEQTPPQRPFALR